MKDLPHARRRPGRGRSEYSFQTVAYFAWSDDRPFPIFLLVTVAHFA
jgi:hypothetical protein